MKAGSKFLNAVSAVALSAGVVSSGAGIAVLASAVAAEAAVVQRIDVRGAQRVGAEAVRSNLSIQPGRTFSNADIDESVKRLYATGFFSDVQISVSGGTLVVTVAQRNANSVNCGLPVSTPQPVLTASATAASSAA